MAASAGAACRTVAPPVAGYLYTIGSRYGISGLAWYGSGVVAILGSVQCFMIAREKKQIDCEYDIVPNGAFDVDVRDRASDCE